MKSQKKKEKKEIKPTFLQEWAHLSWGEWTKRVAIVAFMGLHLSAICWWLIPANGYPSDARTLKPPVFPKWVVDIEQSVFAWKRSNVNTAVTRMLEDYIFLTASWQRWWLFAPNPTNVHDWITVYAVTGWNEPDQNDPNLDKEPLPPWNNRRKPVYDPVPIFKSYPGKLEDSIHGHVGFYRHDSKMVENLVSGRWNEPLGSFAQWCSSQYRDRTGHWPMGVHVIMHRGMIPRPFEGRTIASQKVSERVLWYLHY